MTQLTIESWSWDYTQVTNRKSFNRENKQVLSTHEGTWLSVAIGAYCALKKYNMNDRATDVADVILAEIKKEIDIVEQLRADRDHINFIRTAPLVAHNFGDLDRVMVQWDMHESDDFCKSIYKLGHIPNDSYNPVLVYTGKVNKEFTSKENHRHMSLRQPKCLRKSKDFLIPVGPFMDNWGEMIGSSDKLDLLEKAEIVTALYEGYKRQDEAFGYIRAFGSIMNNLDNGLRELEQFLAFDFISTVKDSEFNALSKVPREEFEQDYVKRLSEFVCPVTNIKF